MVANEQALQVSSRLSLPVGTATEQQSPRLLLWMPLLKLKTDLADGRTTVKTPNTNLTQRTSRGINKVSHEVVYSTKKKVCLRDTNQMQREQAHNGQEGQLSTETAKTNARTRKKGFAHCHVGPGSGPPVHQS